DGKSYVFGRTELDPKFPRVLGKGKWIKEPEALPKGRRGVVCVWQPDDIPVHVTQTAEAIGSATVVTYTVENKDKKARDVGVRLIVDTMVVDADGHPFEVPGRKDPVTTSADFKGKDVPPHFKALHNLMKDALSATFTLKLGGGNEPAERCSLCRYPLMEEDFTA